MKKILYFLFVMAAILGGLYEAGRFVISYRALEQRVDVLVAHVSAPVKSVGASIASVPILDPHTLPDPKLTPGNANPNISQANIGQTICNPNWSTKSIRPPVSYTTPLKIKQIAQYGYSDTNTADYEEDHLISLELGGDPKSPLNLWPEPYNITYGARLKDKVENYLHAQVCSGNITLLEAQSQVANNWFAVYQQAFGK